MSVLSLTSGPETPDKPQERTLDEAKSEPTQKTKKRVRFDARVRRRYVNSIEERDHKNVWFKPEDFNEARKRERAIREYISLNEELYMKDIENLNAQGVLTDEQAAKKFATVDAAVMDILQEQEKQETAFYEANETGKFFLNCELIAQAYRPYSKVALGQAQSRAVRAKKHVTAILRHSSSSTSLFSPSRFVKGGLQTQRSPRTKRSLVATREAQLPSVSVFVAEHRQ